MTVLEKKDAPGKQPVWDVPKVRQCLSCEAKFHSEWSGERICPRCKSTAAWRKGELRQPHSAGRRR